VILIDSSFSKLNPLALLTFGQGEQEIKLMLASGETILSNQDQF
jgi:hypothetical protein